MTRRDEILAEVAAERERQIAKGYDLAHDRTHGTGHIISQIDERVTAWRVGSSPRSDLNQLAALAVAAVEVADEEYLESYRSSLVWDARIGQGPEGDRS